MPLFFAKSVGFAPKVGMVLKRVAEKICTKRKENYSETMAIIRQKLRFSLMRSTLIALTGTKRKSVNFARLEVVDFREVWGTDREGWRLLIGVYAPLIEFWAVTESIFMDKSSLYNCIFYFVLSEINHSSCSQLKISWLVKMFMHMMSRFKSRRGLISLCLCSFERRHLSKQKESNNGKYGWSDGKWMTNERRIKNWIFPCPGECRRHSPGLAFLHEGQKSQ